MKMSPLCITWMNLLRVHQEVLCRAVIAEYVNTHHATESNHGDASKIFQQLCPFLTILGNALQQ